MQKELIIGLSLLLCCACAHREHSAKELPALRVKTVEVASQAGSAHSRYVGTIEPVHETPLSLQTAGRVLSIHAKNGDRVRQGQVLLRVDSTQAVNALLSAEAALHQAEDGFERVKQVHGKGAVTDQKMVEIESQLARARSLYEAARQQVNECTLFAPCDGVLNGLDIEKGQMVAPGVRLCSILDLTAFSVKFTVPETEIGDFVFSRQSSAVSGEIECAAADTVLPIRITEKNLKANPVTHTYEVKARIIGGADVLMTGMVGKVRLSRQPSEVSTQTDDIVIPANCILLKPEGPTVWLKEDGQAVRREITIDGYQADGVRVKSGLNAGDSLIIEGYQKLYMGCKVIDD